MKNGTAEEMVSV